MESKLKLNLKKKLIVVLYKTNNNQMEFGL
jgi:hypothetical protein